MQQAHISAQQLVLVLLLYNLTDCGGGDGGVMIAWDTLNKTELSLMPRWQSYKVKDRQTNRPTDQ